MTNFEPDATEGSVTMDETQHEELSSPRKRGSSSTPSTDNPERKKRKANNASKASSQDNENGSSEDKENNGQRHSSTSRRRNTNESSELANDYLSDRNINSANKPAEAGIIKQIYAENFMCHKKLTVDFHRNVNFIYGQNGSGKSAILAALQICLGAGARRTNRARNMKDLVRKDSTSSCARVRVTLLNMGDDAYQHEKYGDSITVERTIAVAGGYNGYKLYGADKVEQSRSKKDLIEMLDKLNIQVENPVAILDQEDAKKFLAGKAKDKFAFFMKATELERLDMKYAEAQDEIFQMGIQAERVSESLERQKQIVDEMRKAWKKHAAVAKLEGKKSTIQVQFAWANYKLSCEDHQRKLQRFEMFREKAERKREELTQAEAATQDADDPNDERRKQLDTLSEEADQMAARKKQLEQELKKATEPHKAWKRQFKLLVKEEQNANRGLLEANQRLQAKRDEISANAGSAESDQARRIQRLQAAENELAEKKSRHDEIKQAITNALTAYENIESDVDGARRMVSQLEDQLRGIDGKIRSMESSSGNSLDMFGQNCAKVKRMVDRATQQGKFRDPVLGPIGFYCKIQPGKDDLATLAELAIGGGMLDRFIVFNAADRKLLQKIRQEARCRSDCGILQQHKHARFTVPEPPKGVETVATVLSIENDLVFNCLVDQAKIDTKALSRSKEESEQLLLIKDNNNRYSVRGGKINEAYFLPKGDNWKLNRGQLQMISNTRRPNRSIGVDKTAAIEDAKNEYQSIREDLKEKNRTYSRLEHEHTDLKKQWNLKRRELRNNELAMDRAMKEIDDVRAEEAAIVDNDIDTTEEEEEVSAAQAQIEEIKENQRKAQDLIREKEPEIQEIREKVDEITARNEMVLNDMKKAELTLSQHYQSIELLKEKLSKKRRKLEQYEELVSQHTEIVGVAQEEANDYLNIAKKIAYMHTLAELRRKQREEAQKNGDQLTEWQSSEYNQEPTEEDLGQIDLPDNFDRLKDGEYYQARIEQVENLIEKEKKRRLENGDDEATAYAKYARSRQLYKGKKDQLDEIDAATKKLKSDIELRRERWGQFRDYICETTDIKFDEILNKKRSSGKIEFDHDNSELRMVVWKDMNDDKSQQNDVKALSGGERSYSTIALLIALGESLETPFRVMDEFDVFLDPKIRTQVIDQLIHTAKDMPHRQFIFITPQDVSHIQTSKEVKIHQMKPPKRRTEAGGLEQQTLEFSSQKQ